MTNQEKNDLYRQFYPKVLGYLNGKLNNQTLAEDLCSDVFLKIYQKLDTFDETKASLSTWIFTIMRNTLTDYYRTRRVFEEIPEEMAEPSSVEDVLCQEETLNRLADALEQLPVRERDLLVLHYYAGVPLTELSPQMGLSYGYVKTLHKKALSKMKIFLETV